MFELPQDLRSVPYSTACHPGASVKVNPTEGANCQLFAYALLAHYGVNVPPWRSSDLWADTSISAHVTSLEPLDLLLWNRPFEPWGAHVGVYLGEGQAAHLSKKLGGPAVWPLERFLEETDYRTLIGAKRVRAVRAAFASPGCREAQ